MIGLYNIKSDLRKGLEALFDICGLDQLHVQTGIDLAFPKLTGLVVDWKPKDVNEHEFAHQAVIIEHYVKMGIPVIIFDRYLKLTYKEYSWLRKFNVTFFEPVIKGRVGFEYFPFWTEPLKDGWFSYVDFDRDTPRELDLAYSGPLDDRIFSFEKYYSEYARLFPKTNIAFHTKSQGLKLKVDEWKEFNVIQTPDEINFKSVGFTILIGSKKEYESGFLNENLFDIMRAGCVPILPVEHRFYGTVFHGVVINDERELDYILVGLHKIRGVLIEDIMNNFLTYFPECNIKTAIERIEQCLKI